MGGIVEGGIAFLFMSSMSVQFDQDPGQANFERSVLDCGSPAACAPYLSRANNGRHTDALIEHLVDVYAAAGDEGRQALVEVLAQTESYHGRPAVQVGIQLEGYTRDDQQRLLEIVRNDPFHDATLLLGHVGSESALGQLIEAQGGQYNRAPFVDAIRVAGDRAIPAVFDRVSSLVREGRDQDAEVLASALWVFAGRDDISALRTPVSAASIEMLFDIAVSADAPIERRYAAMLVIQNGGDAISTVESELLEMARGEDDALSPVALSALMQIGNSVIVPDLLEACEPHGLGDERYFELFGTCPLSYFQSLGPDARTAGPRLLQLLDSDHLDFRVQIIGTLAAIQYEAAIPQLREKLRSEFWSEVLAAAKALRALDDTDSRNEIEVIARSHWFPYLRAELQLILDDWPNGSGESVVIAWSGLRFPTADVCLDGRFAWEGELLDTPGSDAVPVERGAGDFGYRTNLDLGTFTLIGTDRGEWGGELFIQSGVDEPVLLVEDNVLSMRRIDGGALVATGLNHGMRGHGNIYRVSVDSDGWELEHLTEVSGPSYGGLVAIDDRTFAAFEREEQPGTRQFVSVFDVDDGMLGLAQCVVAD